MPLLECVQRSPEWYAARDFRVTASTAAGCLGLDPWSGPFATFNVITRRTKKDVNAYMRWGGEKEETARRSYEIETGNIVTETGFWVHPEFSWLGASPDGLVGENGLLEAKCPSNGLPELIPTHHEIQCIVQMACTEREFVDYYAWMPTGTPFLARLKRDLDQERYLLIRLKDFYDRYIFPDVAPPRRRPT